MNLTKCKIKDLGTVLTGNTPPTSQRKYYGNLYPLIKPTDMKIDERYIGHTEESLSEEGYKLFENKLFPKNTPCVVTIGTIGKLCLTKEPSFCNQAVNSIIVDQKLHDPMYIFYLMKISIPKVKFLSSGTASGRENVSKSAFQGIEVEVPPLYVQKKIAFILSTYDDLIENNTRRIEILEQMAKLVYEEWFVKFRFPGHEKVKMVSSELGEIPEGWNVKTLGELGKIITGKTPPTKNEENYGDYMPFIKTPDMHGNIFCVSSLQCLSKIGEVSQKNKTLPANTLLVSCIGTVGVVSITSTESQTNQQINALIPHSSDKLEYLYFELKKLKAHLENLGSNGVTLTNVNKEKFQSIKIIYPDDNLVKSFHEIVYPIFNQIKVFQFKNQNLRKTRDLLLPKLISGEIDVSDLDIRIRNEFQES